MLLTITKLIYTITLFANIMWDIRYIFFSIMKVGLCKKTDFLVPLGIYIYNEKSTIHREFNAICYSGLSRCQGLRVYKQQK
jgi:hypothetical protein